MDFAVSGKMQTLPGRFDEFGGKGLIPLETEFLGMTDDTIPAFYDRRERAARIYDGADEVHKVTWPSRSFGAMKGNRSVDGRPAGFAMVRQR